MNKWMTTEMNEEKANKEVNEYNVITRTKLHQTRLQCSTPLHSKTTHVSMQPHVLF